MASIKKDMCKYDDWKLASPEYTEMVSSCCGDECEETETEIYGEIGIVCIACGDYCETIEEYEYKEQQREKYEEERSDARRKYNE